LRKGRWTQVKNRFELQFTGLFLSLAIPSAAVIQKYSGLSGVFAYFGFASIATFIFFRKREEVLSFFYSIGERRALFFSITGFLILIAAFSVIYPIANSGVYGAGSDADDALNIVVKELFSARYPYYVKTYLGKPVSPMPGALFFAAPFVALGSSAVQNFFWLAIFFVFIRSLFKKTGVALLFFLMIFILSPVIFYKLMTGGDYISNSIYILLFMYWMISVSGKTDSLSPSLKLIAGKEVPPPLPFLKGKGQGIGLLNFSSAALMGIALSSRANYILLLPILFSALLISRNFKYAAKQIAITLTVFGVITLPFYLYDPASFSPLTTLGKMDQFSGVLPHAAAIISIVTLALSIVLSYWQIRAGTFEKVFRNVAFVMAFPVVAGMVLQSVETGVLTFFFAKYGLFFLFFGVFASFVALMKNPEKKYG